MDSFFRDILSKSMPLPDKPSGNLKCQQMMPSLATLLVMNHSNSLKMVGSLLVVLQIMKVKFKTKLTSWWCSTAKDFFRVIAVDLQFVYCGNNSSKSAWVILSLDLTFIYRWRRIPLFQIIWINWWCYSIFRIFWTRSCQCCISNFRHT